MNLHQVLAAIVVSAIALASPLTGAAQPVDEDAAVALAKKGNCYKCHAIEKRKKAPSYKEIAQKYRGKASAEREIFLHMTGNPVVKLEDGEEKHTAPDTKDEKELMNLVRWVLSR